MEIPLINRRQRRRRKRLVINFSIHGGGVCRRFGYLMRKLIELSQVMISVSCIVVTGTTRRGGGSGYGGGISGGSGGVTTLIHRE